MQILKSWLRDGRPYRIVDSVRIQSCQSERLSRARVFSSWVKWTASSYCTVRTCVISARNILWVAYTDQHRLYQWNVKVSRFFILLKDTENKVYWYGLKSSKGMVVVVASTLGLLAFLRNVSQWTKIQQTSDNNLSCSILIARQIWTTLSRFFIVNICKSSLQTANGPALNVCLDW